MNALLPLIAAVVLGGCSALRKAPEAEIVEYSIPVVRRDNTVDTFIVEQPVDEKERLLFCIEGQAAVVCVGAEDGRAIWYTAPLGGPALRPDSST